MGRAEEFVPLFTKGVVYWWRDGRILSAHLKRSPTKPLRLGSILPRGLRDVAEYSPQQPTSVRPSPTDSYTFTSEPRSRFPSASRLSPFEAGSLPPPSEWAGHP